MAVTPNLGFNVFQEMDVVDFEEINDNFEKLDDYVMITEAGTSTATVGSDVVTWSYRKFSNHVVEMEGKLELNNTLCNVAVGSIYNCANITVNLPITVSILYDRQISASCPDINVWACDKTASTATSSITACILTTSDAETAVGAVAKHKELFIKVKGTYV